MATGPADVDTQQLSDAIRSVLSDPAFLAAHPDILKPEYRDQPDARPFAGHCYVASQSFYHLAGGKAAGWKACGMSWAGGQHWWVKNIISGEHRDLTAEQFAAPVPYEQGKGRGFLTKHPDTRARMVLAALAERFPALMAACAHS